MYSGLMLTSTGNSLLITVGYMAVIFAFFYFAMIRPQRKEEKAKNAMIDALEVGDSVLTTAGFYGVVIDINGDTVIVEFGSNRNCRIPMQKMAIAQVEKPQDAVISEDDSSK
ncbi:MAG: preprotein translocase subunit YajC [Lachnospiraceae bacterium]|nr:preprotein translocase subunit YajC [Lachnospiraceae bacterium]